MSWWEVFRDRYKLRAGFKVPWKVFQSIVLEKCELANEKPHLGFCLVILKGKTGAFLQDAEMGFRRIRGG